jgi:hypothetical protein
MPTFAVELTSLNLNGHTFKDYIDGDVMELNPVNPATSRYRGKNSVAIIKRADADVHDLVIRVLRYSDDDVFLNSQRNLPVPVTFSGSAKSNYVSEDGTTQGVESWILSDGSITTQPSEVYNNTEYNGAMEYTIQFNSAVRLL